MADEKTEAPTPKRLHDARKKGEVAKSKELVSAVTIVMGFALVVFLWSFATSRIGTLMKASLDSIERPISQALGPMLLDTGIALLVLTVPVLGAAALAGLAANLSMVGFMVTFHPLMPQLSKLDPSKNLKRIFGKDNWVDFAMSVAKTFGLGCLGIWILWRSLPGICASPQGGFESTLSATRIILERLLLEGSLLFLALALVDVIIRKKLFLKNQNMSKKDIKDEYKESEGDPLVKGRLRSLREEAWR